MKTFPFSSLSAFLLAACILIVCGSAPMLPAQAVPSSAMKIAELRKAVPCATSLHNGEKLEWYDARELVVEGRGWTDTETFFERLPARAKPGLTPAVRNLCANSAGIVVRFVTDAPKIYADWTTTGFSMHHMAPSGIRGLDLYSRRGERWVFEGIGRPLDEHTTATIGTFMPPMPAEPTEFMLYLPLYDATKDLRIAVAAGSLMALPVARPAERARPIVFYGTSITQGGCASRSGMAHPAILGRWLDREVINLGFSGAGKMEPEMAALLAELDPALYVLECLPNLNADMVAKQVTLFVHTLRAAHPETPILLVENPIRPETNTGNAELRKAYSALLAENIPHLHYLPGEGQFHGPEHGTVDGVHPTDLGFLRLAQFYSPVLSRILGQPLPSGE